MELSIVRILVDFGLVVLIWMVQLLIYPSFSFFNAKELREWHKKYTQGMFVVVMPLMVGQLVIAGIQLFYYVTVYSIAYLLIVIFLWGVTFVWFVPLHGKIANAKSDKAMLIKLERRNWLRTIIWTLLFVFSMGHFVMLR